jgi:hypothetical protein
MPCVLIDNEFKKYVGEGIACWNDEINGKGRTLYGSA